MKKLMVIAAAFCFAAVTAVSAQQASTPSAPKAETKKECCKKDANKAGCCKKDTKSCSDKKATGATEEVKPTGTVAPKL